MTWPFHLQATVEPITQRERERERERESPHERSLTIQNRISLFFSQYFLHFSSVFPSRFSPYFLHVFHRISLHLRISFTFLFVFLSTVDTADADLKVPTCRQSRAIDESLLKACSRTDYSLAARSSTVFISALAVHSTSFFPNPLHT